MRQRREQQRLVVWRMKHLVRLLRAGKNIREIARALEINEKTARRDVNYLREMFAFEIVVPNVNNSGTFQRPANTVSGHCPFCEREI